jgi:hypothetical protein
MARVHSKRRLLLQKAPRTIVERGQRDATPSWASSVTFLLHAHFDLHYRARMATHVREDAAIETAADICGSIAGALDADSAARHLAPNWDGLTAKADGLSAARRTAERTLARARARLAVMDAVWDPEIAAFGRDLFDRSAGNREQAPYTRFFKTTTPSAAQEFGIEREVQQGKDWIAELGRDPNEDLAKKWTPRLVAVNENLETASTNRRNALQALALQGTAEELFISDLNLEIDKLEGELLKLFPGQPKRVAAFLDATKPRRSKRLPPDGE